MAGYISSVFIQLKSSVTDKTLFLRSSGSPLFSNYISYAHARDSVILGLSSNRSKIGKRMKNETRPRV